MAAELDRLRAELDQVRSALADAQRQAEAARAEQDRFLSSLSHELRTPLSAILLWTSLLEEQKLSEPAQLREAVDAIRHSAEEQQALVENLVDTARILSGRLRLERQSTPLGALVQAALEKTEPAAREKQVVLDPPALPQDVRVNGDRDRLQQALGLLLSNAVKFTPAGGHVSLLARHQEQHVLLAIRDTGIGLPPEQVPTLFDGPKAERRLAARMESGLGFGLLIARRLVELQHGGLSAASAGVGQGATFTMRLPIASA